MDHYEMVEKLRQKANVSYEEAKAALEATDWDILDALVLLESEGKVKAEQAGKEYTTQEEPVVVNAAKADRGEFKDGVRRFLVFLRKLFQKGNANCFVISRRSGEVVSMPITVLILLLLCLWPFSMIVLVIGLFVGLRYSFRGPDMGAKVNEMMDKAANAAQGSEEDSKQ